MRKLLLLLLFVIPFIKIYAQAPANDNCSGAIELTVNANNLCGTSTEGTTIGATQSQAGCNFSVADDDVWYKFTATATTHKISATAITMSDPVLEVFSGSCGSLISLVCVNDLGFPYNHTEKTILTGLTIGEVYFIRVYAAGSAAFTKGTFSVCVGVPVPPANDNCASAVALAMNENQTCTLTTNGNSEDATQSLTGCYSGSNADDDVWFSFTATQAAHFIKLSNGSIKSPILEIFKGSCGSLVSIFCDIQYNNNAGFTIGELVPGNTYFIRVYSYYGTAHAGSFSLCINEATGMPANDACSGALTLTANTASCTTLTSADLENATGAYDATCVGDKIKDDVWFKFTATDTKMILKMLNHSISSPQMELFSGTCGSLSQILCGEYGFMVASNLTIGQVYYLRVWSRYGVSAGSGGFDLCLSTSAANNEISSAVLLQTNNDFTCTLTNTSDNLFAISNLPVSNSYEFCAPITNGAWYKFTALNDSLEISLTPQTNSGPIMEVYHMVAGNPVFLQFSEQKVILTDAVQGDEYFILIFNCTTYPLSRGTYDICIKNLPPPPANDNCATAIALTVNNDFACSTTTEGTSQNALGEEYGCNGSPDDDVWYSFVATATEHQITVTPGTMNDATFAVYDGSCGTLNELLCQNNTCCSDPETNKVTGLTIGETYYIQVFSSALYADQGTFTICVNLPIPVPTNDDCANAESINAGDCIAGTNVNIESTDYDYCAEFEKRNVWYKFTAGATSYQIELTRGSIQNVAIDVWSGGCFDTFGVNTCDIGDDNSAVITKDISGLNVGQEYFITVSTRETYEEGTFTICLNSLTPPANNLCENAQNLSMNGSVFPTNFTSGTTQFSDGNLLGCNATFMVRDVWYTFTATHSTHLVFLKTALSFGGKFEVFSGDCNSLSSIFCSTNNFTNSDYSSQEVTGLTVGQVYRIRVYSEGNNGTIMGTFNIAVAEMQAINDCEGAENLVYNLENSNVVLESKSLTTLSQSNNVDCFGNGDNGIKKDAWFKFVPTTTSALLYFKALGSGVFYTMSFQKGSCGNLSCVGISNIGTFSDTLNYQINNLEIGATYFVRIRYAGDLQPNSFGIFVKAFADPKCKNANTLLFSNRDNPVFKPDSIHLNPDPFYSSLNTPVDSVVVLNPNICLPENTNWYKFIPQSANQMLWLETFVFNAQFTIKTGTCENLSTFSDCEEVSPGKVKNLTNLQIGQDYYLVLGAENTSNANNLSFGNILIGMTNSTAPTNEICNDALSLNICESGDSCRTQKYYSNLSAASSSSTCTSQTGPAVWFKFVATASSVNAILENLAFDAYVDLFEGTCSTLQLLACNIQSGALQNIFEMSNLQIGNTYFLKVYSSNPLLFKINLVKQGKSDTYPFQDQGCIGVNLVTDPGFEKQNACPTLFVPTPSTPGQDLAPGSEWKIPSTGSSDLFSSCAAFEATIDVPRNPTFGIQYPFAGKSFAGFYASSTNYREYLKHTLSDSLEPGKTYLLSMYVSKADYEGRAQNGLGFGLSVNSQTFNGNTVILTDTAVIATGNPIVSNSEKWTRLTATFTADKKYKHLYLGNFRTQANSQTQTVPDLSGGIYGGYDGRGSVNLRSYYFVDEVFVGELKDQIACAANPCSQNLTLISPQDNINNTNIQKITNQEIQANITIQGNANVLFQSNKSILMDGHQGVFEVKNGVVFEAKIGGCGN